MYRLKLNHCVQLNERSVVFGVTLKLLVINILSSSPAINKLRRFLPAIGVTTFHGPASPVDNT